MTKCKICGRELPEGYDRAHTACLLYEKGLIESEEEYQEALDVELENPPNKPMVKLGKEE